MDEKLNIVEIFEPLECCSDLRQRCGPPDALRRLRADVDWLTEHGATIRLVAPQHDGVAAYMGNAVVRDLLESNGNCLPMVLVDGKPTVIGRYPSRQELAQLAGLQRDVSNERERRKV